MRIPLPACRLTERQTKGDRRWTMNFDKPPDAAGASYGVNINICTTCSVHAVRETLTSAISTLFIYTEQVQCASVFKCTKRVVQFFTFKQLLTETLYQTSELFINIQGVYLSKRGNMIFTTIAVHATDDIRNRTQTANRDFTASVRHVATAAVISVRYCSKKPSIVDEVGSEK